MPKLSLRLPVAWRAGSDGVGMSLRTPAVAALAVLSALGGVAAAAIALPTTPPRPIAAATASPTATPTAEVRTKTIRRTIHVVRRDKAGGGSSSGTNTARPGALERPGPAPRRARPAPGARRTRRVRGPSRRRLRPRPRSRWR